MIPSKTFEPFSAYALQCHSTALNAFASTALASLPARIKNGPGAGAIIVDLDMEAHTNTGWVFTIGGVFANGFGIEHSGTGGNELRFTVCKGGAQRVAPHTVPHINHRMRYFAVCQHATRAGVWVFRDGRHVRGDAGIVPFAAGGALGTLNAFDSAGLTFFNRDTGSGVNAAPGAIYRLRVWYAPAEDSLSDAQIAQAAQDTYERNDYSLLPDSWLVLDTAIDSTDLTNGTLRNKADLTHVITFSNGPMLTYRRGALFTALQQVNSTEPCYGRIASNAQFDIGTGSTVCLWESIVHPMVGTGVLGAGNSYDILGDTNNALRLLNDAGTLKIQAKANATTDKSAPFEANPAAGLRWLHAGLLYDGTNLYACAHGYRGAGTAAAASAAAGNFNLGNAADSATRFFYGKHCYHRFWKIAAAHAPSAAEWDEILRFHASAVSDITAPPIHPKLQELLDKRVGGAAVATVLTYSPENIVETDYTTAAWNGTATNMTAVNATIIATGPAQNAIIKKGGHSRRVIYVGDPTATTPTGTPGVPAVGGGAAAGPYPTPAEALAEVAEAVTAGVPGDAISYGLYDYFNELVNPAPTSSHNGYYSKRMRMELPIVAALADGCHAGVNAASWTDGDIVGGFHTRIPALSAGITIGATAARISVFRATPIDCLGSGIQIVDGASRIELWNCLPVDSAAYGIEIGAAVTDTRIRNCVTHSNVSGAITAPAGTDSNFNNYEGAVAGGMSAGVYDVISDPPIFKDTTADDYTPLVNSVVVHAGEKLTGFTAGWTQGPFEYSINPKYAINLGGGLVAPSTGGAVPLL